MARILDATQDERSKRSTVAAIPLVVITIFSDRVLETVSETLYFSDRHVTYDFGNTGTDQQFEAFLQVLPEGSDVMRHLPGFGSFTGASPLSKTRRILLRNGVDEASGDKLWKTLRAKKLERARIEIAEILIDAATVSDIGAADLSSMTGNEHTTLYRGAITHVANVTNEEIELEAVTEFPQIPFLIASDETITDPKDIGRRLPIVYGAMKKVPAISYDVGFATALAEAITDTQTGTIQVTDTTGFQTAGDARIGTEELHWTGKTATTLTGVTRGQSGTTASAHQAGEVIVEIITAAVFVVAGHAVDAINDVYIRSPYTQEIVRITTAFTKTISDTTTISGETVASISFTLAQLRLLLDELFASAEVSQQPDVTHVVEAGLPEESPISGEANLRDNLLSTDFRIDTEGATGDPSSVVMNFDPPTGTIVKQIIRINTDPLVNYGINAGLKGEVRVKLATFQIGSWQDAFSGWREFTSTVVSNQTTVQITMLGGGSDTFARINLNEIRRAVIIQADDPTLTTTTAIIGAAVGFSLHLFADVDGFPAPAGFSEPQTRYNFDSDVGSWNCNGADYTCADEATIKKEGAGSLRISSGASAVAGELWQFEANFDYGTRLKIWFFTETILPFNAGDGFRINLRNTASDQKLWMFGTGPKHGNPGIVQGWNEIDLDLTSVSDLDQGTLDLTDIQRVAYLVNFQNAQTNHDFYFDDQRDNGIGQSPPIGDLIEKPADIVKHVIAFLCGEGIATIDDAGSFATAATNLGAATKHALILNSLGIDFEEILTVLGFEMRSNILIEEDATRRRYKMFAAESDYEWPASAGTLSLWVASIEEGRDVRQVFTRFRFGYEWDPSLGRGGPAMKSIVRIDADENDVTKPSVTDLQNAEKDFGRMDADLLNFLTIQDTVTAKERAGYYAHELIRVAAIVGLSFVPPVEGYAIQRADVHDFVNQATGDSMKGRVIEVTRTPDALTNVRLVEVN